MAIEILSQGAQKAAGAFIRQRPFDLNPHTLMIVQIVIIAFALFILWWMIRGHYKSKMFSKDDSPLDILNKRYAAGEIKKEDYDQLKKDIGA
jgi:uncharacterized membrane protein